MDEPKVGGQQQIKRTLSRPEALRWLGQELSSVAGRGGHRTALARATCQHFGLVDPRGEPALSSCLHALRQLEEAGHVRLPAARTRPGRGQPQRLDEPVPPATGVPAEVGTVSGLQLALVTTAAQLRVWNELMLTEHPRGAGPLVGRQLRYLIGSDHGWLGGVGFASAALQLADRDRWIGWDAAQRRSQLERVVCLSRLLIRPGVHCRHLASRVLSLSLRALPRDFQRQYGYEPWLVESFVDPTEFAGTCYQAANWVWVGRTRGRGRQDRQRRGGQTEKDIYVYPLWADFRRRMGLCATAGRGPLPASAGLAGPGWAVQEFGGAVLGDARLSRRLVDSAVLRAADPGSGFTGVSGGDWAAIKGYYRLIDQPETSGVTLAAILAPHQQQTQRRMQAQTTVLCVQDGTDLDFNHLDECDGLGVIGTNQTGAETRGLYLHTTLAVATNGLPLGVLHAHLRAPQPVADAPPRSAEDKESFGWIAALRHTAAVAAQMPQTRLITVADRAADFFALFDEQRRHPQVDLLVRAKHNRNLGADAGKLFAVVGAGEIKATVQVPVGRQSRRPKRSKQTAREARPGRTAALALRYQAITLPAPLKGPERPLPLTLWALHAQEQNPPEGYEPIEWYLLTTLALEQPEQAIDCLRWYCLRWRIEDWHGVLKTGCRVERLAHDDAHRLARAIAIYLVIAWRLMVLTLIGRETPQLPAEVLFSDIELEVLAAVARRRRLPAPAQLGDAVLLVAKLGGYIGRRRDPPPGHQLMWQGYTKLQAMVDGFALARDA